MTLLFSFCSQTKLKQQYNNTTQENLLGALTNHVSVFRHYLIKTDLDTMQWHFKNQNYRILEICLVIEECF